MVATWYALTAGRRAVSFLCLMRLRNTEGRTTPTISQMVAGGLQWLRMIKE